ncbi:restriction endonuclease fold toxin-2 domain-containing protein [uncultured Actinomyces sp.]|uniref:restriction endonuclease fold toxin-2 domain-containing protein n=1 Tax=uncultured Actinomyces sp. TaxID=249061 RepID=UPI0037DC5747
MSPKLQDILMSGFVKEIEKYRAVVESSGNPMNRLTLVTNTPEAQAYLYQRALEALDGKIPFEV